MVSLTTIVQTFETPLKMSSPRKVTPSKHEISQPSTWQSEQKTTKVSLLGTMDWFLLVASFVFIILSALLIANGTCSHSRGLSARAPVCIGGHLSVQSWLAIVGVESGALAIIIPRVSRLLVSKYLTHRLIYHSLGLAKVLNSQTTAPWRTQLAHGSNAVFLLRIPFIIAAIAFSILYKFSFVKVSRYSSFPLATSLSPIPLGYDANGHVSAVSNNLVDALDPSNPHSSLLFTVSSPDSSSNPLYTQVFGPSLNRITLSSPSNQVSTGVLTYCTPAFYSVSTVTGSSSSWVPPSLTTNSNGNGLRITNTDGSLIDISSCNGTMTIMAGVFGQTDITPHYTSYLTANISVCSGYVSWAINNVLDPSSTEISTTPHLQPPIGITCTVEPFDLDTWISAASTEFILGLLQGLSWTSNDLARKAMDIVLSTIDHTVSIAKLSNTSPPPPEGESHPGPDSTNTTSSRPTSSSPTSRSKCSSTSSSTSTATPTPMNLYSIPLPPPACRLSPLYASNKFPPKFPPPSSSPNSGSQQAWVLTGNITNNGTGQTLLGTILQALITAFSVFTILLLCSPGLPLITEWSAQWLGLVYGLEGMRVQEVVEGTSAGGNHAVEVGTPEQGSRNNSGDGAASGGVGEELGVGVWALGDDDERETERTRRDLKVWLGSAGGVGGEGNLYLVLGLEKGRVRRGWGHV